MYINQYNAKGFRIKGVTSDGEPAIKATKLDLDALGVELNILGHGSQTPHAEAQVTPLPPEEITVFGWVPPTTWQEHTSVSI